MTFTLPTRGRLEFLLSLGRFIEEFLGWFQLPLKKRKDVICVTSTKHPVLVSFIIIDFSDI